MTRTALQQWVTKAHGLALAIIWTCAAAGAAIAGELAYIWLRHRENRPASRKARGAVHHHHRRK